MEDLKRKIRDVFDKADDQIEVLTGIYKLYIPDTENVIEMYGWPSCGFSLYWFIANHFKRFDFEHHPKILPGHLWLVKGFTEDPQLDDWAVDLSTCHIKRNEEPCFV